MPSNLGSRAAFQLNPLRNYSPTKTEKIGKMLKKNRQNVEMKYLLSRVVKEFEGGEGIKGGEGEIEGG